MTNNFYTEKRNGVPFYKSENIAFTHGFSTRLGGVSVRPHLESLNLGSRLGDESINVAENLRRFALSVGFDPADMVSAHQIHSGKVFYVTGSDRGRDDFEGDGFVTDRRGVTLSVRTADCVPILFGDEKAGVIGAVHAGWKGTIAKVAPACFGEMLRLGAEPENIMVAIGACIHFCCYEVDKSFRKAVAAAVGEELCGRFVKGGDFPEGKYHCDLPGLNIALLTGAGAEPENISLCPECTCCKPDIFFSHRASGGKREVMMAAIEIHR